MKSSVVVWIARQGSRVFYGTDPDLGVCLPEMFEQGLRMVDDFQIECLLTGFTITDYNHLLRYVHAEGYVRGKAAAAAAS